MSEASLSMATESRRSAKGLCIRCKAYSGNARCSLGYPIEKDAENPERECPRPLTYLALLELRSESKDQDL